MQKILLMMASGSYRMADAALQSAKTMAAFPDRLTFGLCLEEEPSDEELRRMAQLGDVQFLCPSYDAWQAMRRMWHGEGYVLMGGAGMVFERNWDVRLLHILRTLRRREGDKAALTGCLPLVGDPVNAVSAIGVESFDQDGLMHLQQGATLRYAARPRTSAFVHPEFCFAPAQFYLDEPLGREPLFLRAFRCQWHLYTLHQPVIHLKWEEGLPPCDMRGYDGGREGGLRQFEQRFGIRFDKQQLSSMVRQGVFHQEHSEKLRVPYREKGRQIWRAVSHRGKEITPLCVTMQVKLPLPPANLPEEYMSWFEHLAHIRSMALLCYADGEHIRRIARVHPNVLEYKPRYALPVQAELSAVDGLKFIKLSKPFMLRTSREKFFTHSHYVWMDFGCLRYPVYENTWLDWKDLCTDKIVLGCVAGVPDLSMFTVPESRLMDLCREIGERSARKLRLDGHLPEESDLWEEMIQDWPQWFDVREIHQPRQLLTQLLHQK